jgi:aspartyl-tRNA(Asn)/glutamyl-tRNA(Gln) amidotransferase subunit C
MKIDREEARRIADLAHLEFDDAGLDRMAAEMSKILGYMDQLKEVEIEGFSVPRFLDSSGPDDSFPDEPRNRGTEEPAWGGIPLREDEPRPSTPIELVERNAPAFAHGHFVVPKVIGGQ